MSTRVCAVVVCIQRDLKVIIRSLLDQLGYLDENVVGPLPLPGASYDLGIVAEWVEAAVTLQGANEVILVHHLRCQRFALEGRPNNHDEHRKVMEKARGKIREGLPNIPVRRLLLPEPVNGEIDLSDMVEFT